MQNLIIEMMTQSEANIELCDDSNFYRQSETSTQKFYTYKDDESVIYVVNK